MSKATSWTLLEKEAGPSPEGRSGSTICASCDSTDSLILFGGGGKTVYYDDLWVYSPSKQNWEHIFAAGQTPQERAYHVAVSTPVGMLVFGGWRGNEFLSDTHVLTPSEGQFRYEWREVSISGDEAIPRAYHTANLIGTRVYFFGGWYQGFLSKVDILDTQTWTIGQVKAFGKPPTPRAAHSTTTVGSQLYIFGGESENGRLNDLHVFDTESLSWSTPEVRGKAPLPRSGHSAVLTGKHIFYFGGWDGKHHLNDLFVLDIENMAWLTMGREVAVRNKGPSVRSGHSCIRLPNGGHELMIFGGWNHESFIRDTWIMKLHGFDELSEGIETKQKSKSEMAIPTVLRMSELLEARGKGLLDEVGEWSDVVDKMDCKPAEGKEKIWNLILETISLACEAPKGSDSALSRGDRAHEKVSLLSKEVADMGLNDEESKNEDKNLKTLLVSGLRERTLYSNFGNLKDVLSEEVKALQDFNGHVSRISSDIDIQNLFQAHHNLEIEQNNLHFLLTSPNILESNYQQVVDVIKRRDEILESCHELSGKLKNQLTLLIKRQEDRCTHVSKAIRDIELATEFVSENLSDIGRNRRNGLAPNEKDFGRREGDDSLQDNEEESDSLPDFILTNDSVNALSEPLNRFGSWQNANYLKIRPALERTIGALNYALLTLQGERRSLAEPGNQKVLEQGIDLGENLQEAAGEFLKHLRFECSRVELDHTHMLLADCSSLANKLEVMHSERGKMKRAQEKYVLVRKSLIKTKTESIRLNAEIELTKLRGTSHSQPVLDLLSSLREQVKGMEKSKIEIEKELVHFSERNHPEALLIWDANDTSIKERILGMGKKSKKSSLNIPAKILKSGFVIHGRQLSDYEQVKMLNGQNAKRHVFLVQLKSSDGLGPLKVLKEITLEEEKSRKSFENEVNLLKKLNHPNIVPIEGIFYEGLRAYIQMPYLEGGTMHDWANKQRPTLSKIQSIFRQIFQSLSYLHDQKVVHRDIKLENILMTSNDRPVVCDFGISRVVAKNTMSYTSTDEAWTTTSITGTVTGDGTAVKGTEGYISPEVIAGEALTPAADIWAAGVMLYRTIMLSREEAYDPKMKGREFLTISSDASFPDEVRELFSRMFTLDAKSRISANEVLNSKFIRSSLLSYMRKYHRNLESDRRIEMSVEHFAILRKGSEESFLSVKKDRAAKDFIEYFKARRGREDEALTSDQSDSEWFLNPISVKGDSQGNIFCNFFASLVRNGLFEAASNANASSLSLTFLPSSKHDSETDLEHLFYAGLVLAKALVDNNEVPSLFAPSMYKFLLGQEQDLTDLELYNYSLSFHLHETLAKNPDIVSIEDMKYKITSKAFKSKQVRKHEYVRYTIQQELVGVRRKQLTALKKGFLTGVKYGKFETTLQVLSCTDLMILLCGQQQISPHILIELLNIPQDWLAAAVTTTARDLIDFILHLSSNDLRRFLRFATGHCSLSFLEDQSRSKLRINVVKRPKSNNLPVGRPCLRHIDLPDYNSKGTLQEKMMKAIEDV